MSLDKLTAEERASHFRKGSIVYNFILTFTPEQYHGLAELTFYLEDTNFAELKLDFTGTVTSVNINTIDLINVQASSNFLTFPKKYLQKGRNRISIFYSNKYDTDKLGCISFFDDEKNQYLYTQFEPYAAHRVFPCFDQPDLKAKMRLSLVTPSSWVAISNQSPVTSTKFQLEKFQKAATSLHEQSKELFKKFLEKVGDDTNMTIFNDTEMLSSYLFGFSVGPFLKYESSDGNVPMAIYGMKTSQQLLESYAPFIFNVSQKCMAFFQNFFGVNYPFRKYDQVFIRDHWYSAMQNAGMVTYDEYQYFKANPTLDDYYEFAEVLAHQLSHHWFGNLVTMVWWDDLWLNESFAQYIATYALDQVNGQLIIQFYPAGVYFRKSRARGYVADQFDSATHPIKGDVPDTDVAQSIFDPITYDKGASVIKQLMFLVTPAKFSAAISKYFQDFAWRNATLTDFLNEFKPYFPTTVSIDTWMNTWLLTASLNVFQSIWDPSKQTQTQTLSLYQSVYSKAYKTLRFHKMQIAFFDQNGETTQIAEVLVDPSVQPTAVPYDGSKKVTAVLVNYYDNSFCQNYIDYASLSFFKAHLNLVTDDYSRALIWFNLSAMVRQGLLRVDQFSTVIQVHLFTEPILFILDTMLTQLLYLSQSYSDSQASSTLKAAIFAELYAQLQDPNLTDFDRIQTLSKQYIAYAESDTQVLKLNDWLHGDDPKLAMLPLLDLELSWLIVKKVFAVSQQTLSTAEKWSIFKYVQVGDSSTRVESQRLLSQATIASATGQYEQLYQSLKSQSGYTTANRQFIAQGLTSKFNSQLYQSTYRSRYFADFVDPNVYTKLSFNNYVLFYENMRPTTTDYEAQVTQFQSALSIISPLLPLAAHCTNIRKIVDDLKLKIANNLFNADSNLTLTKYRAEQRAQYIVSKSIQYSSHIGYTTLQTQSAPTYTGFTEITFSLSSIPKLLPIDFQSANIKAIIVNGYNIIPQPAQNDTFIVIPRVYLQQDNTIAIHYQNYYNNDGEGCMAYIDSSVTPSQHYTHTNFQPHGASLFIPCFDQPDLKAYASFFTIVPDNWIAVGNGVATTEGATFTQAAYLSSATAVKNQSLLQSYLANKSGKTYVFKTTQNLPTYLFCLATGEYYSITLPINQQYRVTFITIQSIPMTLYSLASYKDALVQNAPFIFQMTKQSLGYYETNFKVNYPFDKYDSVFCHEYSGGAMQNPGLVTFNDNYLYDANVEVQKLVYFGNVIAHECAHNWFGNYVTMKWWDDLWLNESFANFISYYFLETLANKTIQNIPIFSSSWALGLKYIADAYHEDQMTSTTHPVRSDVPNTSLASTYFDYITYRKGQTTLKQLVFLMGQANFFKGLQSYFVKYPWQNTTIDEFLAELSPFFPTKYPFTLDEWKQIWILEPSLNILTVEWDQKSRSPSATLTINQSNFDQTGTYKTLRYHYVNISFFAQDGTSETFPVLIQNTSTTTYPYNASKGVAAVLVNDDHNDFVKVRFDPVSQSFFRNNINKIPDIMTRIVIYLYLDQQVRDGIVKVNDHVTSALTMIRNQQQDIVFNFVFRFLNEATGQYILSTQRGAIRSTVFQFILNQITLLNQAQRKLLAIKHQSKNLNSKAAQWQIKKLTDIQNRKVLLADLLPAFCANQDQIDILQQWRTNNYADLSKITISVSQAWEVIKLIYTSSRYTSSQRLAKFKQQQSLSPGIKADLVFNTCLSLQADQSTLEAIYELFKNEDSSITVKSSLAQGWNNFVHIQLLQTQFKDLFFKDLPDLSVTLPRKHFQFFFNQIKPIDDDIPTTISLFKEINLVGSEMIGYMISIRKIIEMYALRLKLYGLNKAQQ